MIQSYDIYFLISIIAIFYWDYLFSDNYHIFSYQLPHPVMMMGSMITFGEHLLYKSHHHRGLQFFYGMIIVIFVVKISAIIGGTLSYISHDYGNAIIALCIHVIFAGWLLAAKGLYDHALMIYYALKDNNIEEARNILPCLCGRDPNQLDHAQIASATIESLAENLSDAVVAPLFYYCLFGLTGIFAYKAINSCDSMLGYKSQKYYYFGKFAARLDDIVNYIPAKLTAFLLIIASIVLIRCNIVKIFSYIKRYASLHESPNAGYSEAVMAAALHIALGGKRYYPDVGEVDIWIGDPHQSDICDDNKIKQALRIYVTTCYLCMVLIIGLGMMIE